MIIETKEEFTHFFSIYKVKDVILIPVLSDNKRHVLNNELCILFVKLLNSPEYFILPFNHSETINLNLNILGYLDSINNKKYVLDKKQFLNIYQFNNLIDINVLYYLNNNKSIKIEQKYSNGELFILNNNKDEDYIYRSVPILKLEERLIDFSEKLEIIINENKNLDLESDVSFKFLNDITINNLHKIEKNGINVDTSKLLYFFPDYNIHIDANKRIYSEYNIYTSTGRPSNRFGNLNFSALKKENGERQIITSRFKDDGFIFYFDYEAYHLNLVASLIDYIFPKNLSIHEYLGRQYFGKDKLNEDEYNKSKSISFEILYGGIDDSIANAIPFFGKAKEFISLLWNQYQKDKYIKTNISGKKIYGDNLNIMNPNKLFNYYLQSLETEKNILIIDKLNNLLKNYNTKLIMYLYDGFLFDYCKSDGKELFLKIKNIIEDEGKFKTKQYVGKNFGNLHKIC